VLAVITYGCPVLQALSLSRTKPFSVQASVEPHVHDPHERVSSNVGDMSVRFGYPVGHVCVPDCARHIVAAWAVVRHAPVGHDVTGEQTPVVCVTGAGCAVAIGAAEQLGAGPNVTFESV
jgi:hypothetical protein